MKFLIEKRVKYKKILSISFTVAAMLFLLVMPSREFLLAEQPAKTQDENQDLKKFLSWKVRIQENIKDSEKSKINFAIAEYYFKISDFTDARQAFEDYVRQYPVGVNTFLANIYLYKFAQLTKNQKKIKELKKEIFQDRFILLFDKYKVLSEVSLCGNKYEVHYFVDRIEIFLNGDTFEVIGP